jgi:hypothetical protein
VVYIATPHSSHYAVAKAALEAGKHVLCEKPMTINAREASSLLRLAREKGLFLQQPGVRRPEYPRSGTAHGRVFHAGRAGPCVWPQAPLERAYTASDSAVLPEGSLIAR